MPQTYDASNGGLFNATCKSFPHTGPTDTIPPNTYPAGAANLTYINSSNDVRWNTSLAIAGTDDRVNSQMYKFNISNVSSVTWFEVVWEGFGEHECKHTVNLSVWNYNTSAWELVDWQGGYSNFDRVLGNRRYELPGANFGNYVNQTVSYPNELTVRATAKHHGGPGRDMGKGQGLLTDYVKVVTHTCPRPEPTFTVDGRKGNWYLWKSYYNITYPPITLNNTTFFFEVIDRTNETAYFASGGTTDPGFMTNKVTNCSHAMWLLPWGGNGSLSSNSSDPVRHRVVAAPVVFYANNTMQDAEYWYPPHSSTVVGKANTLPRAFNNTAAVGDAPAIQMYAVTNGSNWDGANATWDAPYTVGDSWQLYEFIDADPASGGNDQWMRARLNYTVRQNISNFNVSSLPRVNGSGKFGGTNDGTQLFNVNEVRYNWSDVPTDNNGNASAEITSCYNDSVENWVRGYNSLRYYGTEDNAIVAYESEDFGRGNLTVTDRGAGQNLDVSINITNTTGKAQKFNALLAVFNLSARTPISAFDYLNGYCVYPNVSANTSSWPYYPAIKTTSNLSPGASETVTWSNVYTLGTGYDYWLWCSGMVYGPWNAR